MDEVVRTSTQKAVSKMVLVALASFANDNGVCWPAMHTLTARAGVSMASLRRAIKALIKSGDLEIETLGNGRSSTVYRILRGINLTPQGYQRDTLICQ